MESEENREEGRRKKIATHQNDRKVKERERVHQGVKGYVKRGGGDCTDLRLEEVRGGA